MSNDTELLHASVIKRIWKKCKEEDMDIVAFAWRIQREAERTTPHTAPLSERELELIDGMIEVQLHHASQCDSIANRTMAKKQKGWDMERVALLRKLRDERAGLGRGGEK